LGNLSVRRGDEGLAPELDAFFARSFSAGVEDVFDADAVGGADVAAVGHRVAALDQLPRIVLDFAVLRFFARMPADRRGVEEDLCALDRGEPRAFGEPLVPANQHADLRVLCIPCAKARVAGREIELL